jgi:YHS domain-containing protein
MTTWDQDDTPIYNEYNGHVYYFMTNKVCKKPNGEQVQHLTEPIPAKKRMFENI